MFEFSPTFCLIPNITDKFSKPDLEQLFSLDLFRVRGHPERRKAVTTATTLFAWQFAFLVNNCCNKFCLFVLMLKGIG